MYRRIGASVGIHNGKQCYNIVDDQRVVQELLNAIPAARGGAEGRLNGTLRWGIASADLHAAILKFQRQNGCSVDGHVDPYGGTLAKLNTLASGSMPAKPGQEVVPGNASPDGPAAQILGVDVEPFLQRLLPRKSTWRFSTSSGITSGILMLVGSVGHFYVENTASRSGVQKLNYYAAGVGISLAPFSLSFSTKDLPGSGIGQLYRGARTEQELTLDDLTGYACIVTVGANPPSVIHPNGFNGGGVSLVFLGSVPGVANALGFAAGSGNPLLIAAAFVGMFEISKATGVLYGTSLGTWDMGLAGMQAYVTGP